MTNLESAQIEDDLSSASALVVDSNPTSRAILVNQLRDFGVGSVSQCTRVVDARRQLEFKTFDIVLCEHHFGKDSATGQDLLDDLRRNQLLPFSTVFVMVTGEASYAKVAEAAESALDGYLLKPHTATNLGDRLFQARQRKISLQDIFAAIEVDDFKRAATLCMERFESRGQFWLYAARIGAELLMRIEKYADAQRLYEAVVAAKTVPWAKLGVARSLLGSGEPTRAISTLENLIAEDPTYADAYDVLGRAQFELGRFDRALDTYKMACTMTPHSVVRLQNLGMMTYYSGDRAEAEKILGKTARVGLDSKMFDPQTLVLLAFARLENNDRKGVQHCQDDFIKLLERHGDNPRYRRLAAIVDALILILDRQFARSVDAVRDMAARVMEPSFDFESASNLLALMGQLANKAIQLDEVDRVVDTLGMRFCTSRSLAELLAGSAAVYPTYAERIRLRNAQVLKYAENAMTLSMGGNPTAAVKDLIAHGEETQNAKLVETAYLVLQRYAAKVEDLEQLTAVVQELRTRFGPASVRPTLGEPKREAGALRLRTGSRSVEPADEAVAGSTVE
ncbi:response regulator [Curvibacter delicatus]|uniref:response regulator n=1 Tax=Curvibacter delicatus TaxID=80879 RepID=UPI001FE1F254|nr:response regulator [Curvibacter delicatus]